MLVLPADQLIQDEAAFAEAVDRAHSAANNGWLTTFGIKPEFPETGFGYIEHDSSATIDGIDRELYPVKRFVEKPDLETAKQYVASGEHHWNSGMFCLPIEATLVEFEAHAPNVLGTVNAALEAGKTGTNGNAWTRSLDPEKFAEVPDISIDYALMERSQRVAVAPCSIGWSDIGSWNAFANLLPEQDDGNRINGEVVTHASRNNVVHSPERLTALIGLEDIVVVDTPDAVLIAHKDHAQDVKHIVKQLKANGHETHLLHRTAHRPWGSYTVLEEGSRFKLKRIDVKPGGRLSLQMHHHRSEHWIVVNGMARVTRDEDEFLLNTNESTFIPAGHVHRFENPGVVGLVLIEVQSGDYLGEDDIIRLEDVYGR